MSFAKQQNRNFGIVENVIFVFAFGFVMYILFGNYWQYVHESIKSKGFAGAIIDPFLTHKYYLSFIFVMFFINAGCLLWEIVSFFIQLFKQAISQATGSKSHGHVFKKALINYKPSFLAALVHQLLSKLFIINMFWVWLPHFQKLELFTVNLQWYSWAYGYICWEFSSWIFHFSCHRVRFLWCLHSPHHAPSELNMTVNWVHFFAEGYYSSFIHLTVL